MITDGIIFVLLMLVILIPPVLIIMVIIRYIFLYIMLSNESEKFPDEEVHVFNNLTISRDQIIKIIKEIFPHEMNYYDYILEQKGNVISIESQNKENFNEYYIIEFIGNKDLSLTSYFYSGDTKLNSFNLRLFVKKLGAKGRLSNYNIHKIKIIEGLGYNYKEVKKRYIDQYSNSKNFYYLTPSYKIQSFMYDNWIDLKK